MHRIKVCGCAAAEGIVTSGANPQWMQWAVSSARVWAPGLIAPAKGLQRSRSMRQLAEGRSQFPFGPGFRCGLSRRWRLYRRSESSVSRSRPSKSKPLRRGEAYAAG